jgi:hypothetical protein
MAISPVRTKQEHGDLVLWETLINSGGNNVGTGWKFAGGADIVGAALGTFDSATLIIQGSHDGVSWVTILDGAYNAISITEAGSFYLITPFDFLRPSTSGGGGSQDIDVFLRSYRKRV